MKDSRKIELSFSFSLEEDHNECSEKAERRHSMNKHCCLQLQIFSEKIKSKDSDSSALKLLMLGTKKKKEA